MRNSPGNRYYLLAVKAGLDDCEQGEPVTPSLLTIPSILAYLSTWARKAAIHRTTIPDPEGGGHSPSSIYLASEHNCDIMIHLLLIQIGVRAHEPLLKSSGTL